MNASSEQTLHITYNALVYFRNLVKKVDTNLKLYALYNFLIYNNNNNNPLRYSSDEPWPAEQPPLAVFPDCTRRYWVDMWSAHRIPQLHIQLSKPDRYFFIRVTTQFIRHIVAISLCNFDVIIYLLYSCRLNIWCYIFSL
jgi:hypothetical protein